MSPTALVSYWNIRSRHCFYWHPWRQRQS